MGIRNDWGYEMGIGNANGEYSMGNDQWGRVLVFLCSIHDPFSSFIMAEL